MWSCCDKLPHISYLTDLQTRSPKSRHCKCCSPSGHSRGERFLGFSSFWQLQVFLGRCAQLHACLILPGPSSLVYFPLCLHSLCLTLTESPAIGFWSHLVNTGWFHLKSLKLITSVIILFPNTVTSISSWGPTCLMEPSFNTEFFIHLLYFSLIPYSYIPSPPQSVGRFKNMTTNSLILLPWRSRVYVPLLEPRWARDFFHQSSVAEVMLWDFQVAFSWFASTLSCHVRNPTTLRPPC